MKYAQTLNTGDKTYVWNGDVCYPAKVRQITARYIIVTRFGRFGAKSGKGLDFSYMVLATGAGEKEVDV